MLRKFCRNSKVFSKVVVESGVTWYLNVVARLKTPNNKLDTDKQKELIFKESQKLAKCLAKLLHIEVTVSKPDILKYTTREDFTNLVQEEQARVKVAEGIISNLSGGR